MRKIAIMSLAVTTIVLASIAFTYPAPPQAEDPAFPLRMQDTGATLVYASSRTGFWGNTSETRVVSVIRGGYLDADFSLAPCVIIRDSFEDVGFTSIVNVMTREILWSDYPGWEEGDYVEYWIPTNVSVGDYLNILHYEDVEVVGDRRLTVDGIQVDCWALRITIEDAIEETLVRDVWYYEKQTGIWVGASWLSLDTSTNPDTVEHCWAGTLVSTNVPLPPARGEPIDR